MENWQRAFVLHQRPYGETSLILDLFTENQGRLPVMARGARRKRAPLRGILQPFTPLMIRWSGRGEIKTLTQAEAISLALPLGARALCCGMYINELMCRLLEKKGVAFNALFFDYLHCIQTLAKEEQKLESALRCFELSLLHHLGYGVDFLHCALLGEKIDDNLTYYFQEETGFIASQSNKFPLFTGNQVRALHERVFPDQETLSAAKRFTRMALRPYLGTRPIKSVELFR